MKISDLAPFGLRIPLELKIELEAAAAKNGRSINAELIFRLRESIKLENRSLLNYSDGELVDELLARYDRDDIYIRIGNIANEGN